MTAAPAPRPHSDPPTAPPLAPQAGLRVALFLDLDGTLLPFADHPDRVRPDAALVAQVRRLHAHLRGALALLSGRPLATLDQWFGSPPLAAAGLHGLSLRDRDGHGDDVVVPPSQSQQLRDGGAAIAAAYPGVIVEDKGPSLALHWRRRPALADAVHAAATELSARLGDPFRLQPGDHVVEIRPGGADKGSALARLMAKPPFLGRQPVMLGDDLTDEDAFASAERLGGYGIVVGSRRPTRARYALVDPAAVRAWMAASLHDPGACP